VIDPQNGIWSEEYDLFWDGSSAIAIYENLSEIDDPQNTGAALFAQFAPAEADAVELDEWCAKHPGEPVKLQLRLAPDLELEAFITWPSGQKFQLSPLL